MSLAPREEELFLCVDAELRSVLGRRRQIDAEGIAAQVAAIGHDVAGPDRRGVAQLEVVAAGLSAERQGVVVDVVGQQVLSVGAEEVRKGRGVEQVAAVGRPRVAEVRCGLEDERADPAVDDPGGARDACAVDEASLADLLVDTQVHMWLRRAAVLELTRLALGIRRQGPASHEAALGLEGVRYER